MSEANNKAPEIAAENQETEQTPAEVIQEELPAVTLDELEGMNMEVFASQEAPDAPVVNTETGEIVEGVFIEEKPDIFSVDL